LDAIARVSEFLNDSLVRGFILTSTLLLGTGLEQGLLGDSCHPSITVWFLTGNLLGLPLGLWLWKALYPKTNLPLYLWVLEGLCVAVSACVCSGPVMALQGLLFGPLILHLVYLGLGRPLSWLVPRVGTGIILGNLLLYFFESLPFPIGIAWLAVALAGWRIKRPETELKHSSRDSCSNLKPLFWLWSFLLFFYTLGGFYYSVINSLNQGVDPRLADIINLAFYVAGLIGVIFLTIRDHVKLNLYIAIIIMGLAITVQISPNSPGIIGSSLMDLSFGIMDCFAISIIIASAPTPSIASIGMEIFPISLLLGMWLTRKLVTQPMLDYQWPLAILFFMIIPVNYMFKFKWPNSLPEHTPLLPALLPLSSNAINSPGLVKKKAMSSTDISSHGHNNKRIELKANDREGKQEIQAALNDLSKYMGLSDRESQVFQGLVSGKKLKQIAKDLQLAIGTVKALSNRIYEKAGVNGKKELLRLFHAFLREKSH